MADFIDHPLGIAFHAIQMHPVERDVQRKQRQRRGQQESAGQVRPEGTRFRRPRPCAMICPL